MDASGKPNVLLYNQADHPGRSALTVDSVRAAREMTEAVLAQGHRRIAFLAGRFAASDRSRLRYRGFAMALAGLRLKPPPPFELDFLDDTPDSFVAELMASDDRPTALFCSNDVLALAVIGALKRLGARLPEDVSVVGFDGIALGQMVEPTLASVVQPARQMGERACAELLAKIGGEHGPPPGFLAHEIRGGSSLGPAPLNPVTIVASRTTTSQASRQESA